MNNKQFAEEVIATFLFTFATDCVEGVLDKRSWDAVHLRDAWLRTFTMEHKQIFIEGASTILQQPAPTGTSEIAALTNEIVSTSHHLQYIMDRTIQRSEEMTNLLGRRENQIER